jgi:hypothetical protein
VRRRAADGPTRQTAERYEVRASHRIATPLLAG